MAITNQTTIKPFIKWAGGKTQLLKTFDSKYPVELKQGKIKNYYEPFLGGGAVCFDILSKYEVENIYLFDLNEDLILTYRVVQCKPENLIGLLLKYQKHYSKLNQKERIEYYYRVRKNYNTTKGVNYNKYTDSWVERASQMIFLNKTCFNGLYRLNKNGEFNVPYGDYKNPKIVDPQNLLNVSEKLSRAEIKVADFGVLLDQIKSDSFVYFDPPYRPISKTSSFNAYSKLEFNDASQIRLAEVFKKLASGNTKLMLSNSDPKNFNSEDCFFDKLYEDFNIERVLASRAINSNGANRGKINEILIKNY